jgi:hypothetical protein
MTSPPAYGVPRHAVATSANRYAEIVIASEPNGRNHVGYTRTSHDQGWTPVDHRVEDRARLVIAVLTVTKNATSDSRTKGLDRRERQYPLRARERGESQALHAMIPPSIAD